MKWLAVDYGDSRTGLAGCDAGETITSPITPQIEEKSMNKVAAAVTAVAQARGAEALADNDTFGAKRKERLDSVSAAVILESFLNWRAHHPNEEPPEMLRPQPAEV